MSRIFILDDEAENIRIAGDLLASEGHVVTSATDSREGLKKLRANPPDLLLLDIRMPGLDGFQVCKEIKADPLIRHIPIVMFSVKAGESDVVLGLELGADDYVRKPYRKRELLARVKTALRRREDAAEKSPKQKLEAGPIRVDLEAYTAWSGDAPLKLTPKEFKLLVLFIERKGALLTRATLSEKVWGIEHIATSRTVDVHVERLRRKLGAYGPWLQTLTGVGYRFESLE
jgi:DNA-binding response OmpR family regulator